MNSKVPRPGLRRGSSAPPRKAKSAPPSVRALAGDHSDESSALPATRSPAELAQLAELSDPFAEPAVGALNPFAELAKESDPFAEAMADPFADPAADAFDPFAESAEAAANQFKLPSAGSEDDESAGLPPTRRGPISIPVDMSDADIQIEISEEDEELEEEAPASPPVSSRSPFGQSYLRSRGEGTEGDRPTVRAPATYPDPELLDQLAKTDDDKDDDEE